MMHGNIQYSSGVGLTELGVKGTCMSSIQHVSTQKCSCTVQTCSRLETNWHNDVISVGGYVLMLNGGAVSWSSRKIKVVSISSFESEWYSASICGCEIAVLRRLMEEISFAQEGPTVLFEDNAACIHVATNQRSMNPRSKHIDVRVFKLKEFVEDGVLQLTRWSLSTTSPTA